MVFSAYHPIFGNGSPESMAMRKITLVFHPVSALSLWQRFRRCLFSSTFENVDVCWNEYNETKEGHIRRKICHLRRICVQDGLVTEVLDNSGYLNALHPDAKVVEIDCFVPASLHSLRKAIRTKHPVSVSTPTHRRLFYQKDEQEKPAALFCQEVNDEICDPYRNKPLYWPHIIVDALRRSSPSKKYINDVDAATISIDELYQRCTAEVAA